MARPKRHMLLVALGAYAAIVSAATTTSASPKLGLGSDDVVEIFVGANCTGKQRRVKMDDLVGGNHDNGWDACGGAWDDGTTMRWPWWRSYRVAAGHAIMTGSRCYDSSNNAYPEYAEVGMTSEAGCVSPDYTFTYVALPLSPPSSPPLPPPPSESPPLLISTPALVSALLILVAVALIFLRQVRFSRDRAKFDLQILGREMRNLEQTVGSATPLWRRRNSKRAPCAAVAPARGESQIDLPCTPQSSTGLVPPPPVLAGAQSCLRACASPTARWTAAAAGVLTKHEVPTKVREISTDAAALEISSDAALAWRQALADVIASEDGEAPTLDSDGLRTQRTRRSRRMRSSRSQSAVM